jgi:hypothetical protein
MPLFYEVVKNPSRVIPSTKIPTTVEELKQKMTPEQRKDMTENDIVNGLARIAKRNFTLDAEFSTSRAIVDNVKLLINAEIEEKMIDLKSLCDEVARVGRCLKFVLRSTSWLRSRRIVWMTAMPSFVHQHRPRSPSLSPITGTFTSVLPSGHVF